MNRINDYTELTSNISNWLKDYLKDSGMGCFVVGVSGGIVSRRLTIPIEEMEVHPV